MKDNYNSEVVRVVLRFGEFTKYNHEIPVKSIGNDIYILHPLERMSINMINEAEAVDAPRLKKMCFEYRQQLDRDLFEYTFKDES